MAEAMFTKRPVPFDDPGTPGSTDDAYDHHWLPAGAKVLGDRMYVTSGKNISIYDISDPAAPKALGGMTANVAWENEEVPTNGQVLAVASDFYSVGVPECMAALAAAY